jgi:hypothetical protein
MPTVLDLLKDPEFADNRLTEVINIPPYQTGRLAQLGLFVDTPIHTTYAKIGIKEGEITIIPARERGGPANKNMSGDRQATLIPIPHFPLDDAITPSDLQNLTVYGNDYIMLALANVYNDKLQEMRSKHDATHANLDWGAINGLIIDAEDKVLLDVYEHFDLAQPTMSFALANAGTDIAAKNRALKAMIRGALKGAPSTGVRVFAGQNWFDTYVGHGYVREQLKYYAGSTPNPAREDIVDTFNFAGLTVERVEEEFDVRLPDGTFETRPAVAADEAIAVPLGTPYFRRYIAPPDTIQDANTAPQPGDKVFVSTDDLPHGKGRDVHTESNVLPVCLRPQVMTKLTL